MGGGGHCRHGGDQAAAGVKVSSEPAASIRSRADGRSDRNDQLILAVAASGAVPCATAWSARSNCRGNVFPLFPARRRIPAQAVSLKKNRGSIFPVSSVEDSEHAAPALRHSEPLRVKHAPFDKTGVTQRHAFRAPAVCGDIEAASCHRASHDSKISAPVAAEGSWYVLPDEPPCSAKMSSCIEYPYLFVEEAGACAGEAIALPGYRQVLAGRTAHHHVDTTERSDALVGDVGDAAKVRHVGVVVRQHGARERLNFSEPDRLPSKWVPCHCRRLDAGEQAQIPHAGIPSDA